MHKNLRESGGGLEMGLDYPSVRVSIFFEQGCSIGIKHAKEANHQAHCCDALKQQPVAPLCEDEAGYKRG
jgi:hypothetical protein